MRNYTIDQCVSDLNKKHDCQVDANFGLTGTIKLLFGKQAKGDVGIKSRGKISFLESQGFRKEWINPDSQR